jgi:hypothetical protein
MTKKEGLSALYRGISANTLKVPCATECDKHCGAVPGQARARGAPARRVQTRARRGAGQGRAERSRFRLGF